MYNRLSNEHHIYLSNIVIQLFNQLNISKHSTCKPKVESIKFLNSPKFVFSLTLSAHFVVGWHCSDYITKLHPHDTQNSFSGQSIYKEQLELKLISFLKDLLKIVRSHQHPPAP